MRKMLRRRELFPAVAGAAETVLTATLRKGHRDLPVFFDELNDALEAHDAEEYGRIAGAMWALLSRLDDKEKAELYPLAQAR
jgi:hypothetical protein